MKGLGLLGVPPLVAASVFASTGSGPALPPADVVAADKPSSSEPVDGPLVLGGRVTTDDARVAHVFSPLAGLVVKVQARQGQRMKKGDPLATIEAPDVGSTRDLYKAQADFIAAQHDVARKKVLADLGEGRADLEAAIDALREARAKLWAARNPPYQLLAMGDWCPHHQCMHTYTPIPIGSCVRRWASAWRSPPGRSGERAAIAPRG